jgi:hypothetical protein
LRDFENNTESSRYFDYHQPSISKQSFKPAKTDSKNLNQYLQPEIAEQFNKSEVKSLSSGKVTFSEPIEVKKWTETAKKCISNK